MEIEDEKKNIGGMTSPPIKIPLIDDVKFRINKDEVISLINSSTAGIKYRK
jgi:hypothetical protein